MTIHQRIDNDCQDYINSLVDADREAKCKKVCAISDRSTTEISPDGTHLIGYNWSAPWIDPPWEEEVHFMPEAS